jgi:asparagine synthase (glutamine-hydrolysing)
MCGIAGYISFKGNKLISEDKLRVMVNTLHHRGPDETGSAINECVAMGMRRLSIIDLSGGSQPIYNEDDSVWTVFNGEIYNFKDLRNDLKSNGHKFKTNTDTEVIVHSYEEYGTEFPSKLNGMFAIVLHDRKKNKVILARDHIGIKPLYYSYNTKRLIFGSEIKAVLASEDVEKELDIDALAEFISWEYVPGKSTLFKSIKKLEPGELIEIDINNPSCNPKPYWDIPVPNGANKLLSPADWEERVDYQIKKSARMQLVSDVPLGAFLSGGVDSSLIVAAMGNAETFSIGFDDPSYNELKWARKVADHLGVNHKDEIIKPDVLNLFQHLMHFMDDPIGDFSIFPTYLVSRLARRHVTVALSGDGGDELFGGYETYLAESKAIQYKRLPSLVRNGLVNPLINSIRPTKKKKGFVNKAKRFIEGLEYQEDLAHTRWRMFVGDSVRSELFSEDSIQTITKPPAAHIIDLFNRAGSRGHLDRCFYVDVKSYLVDNILTKVDRMSMAVSLESRVPYLDPDVVALAFQVPEHLKVSSSETKIILKKIASKYVPKECIYRPKEGFSIPIKNWLIKEFRPLMENHLNNASLKKDGIFNYKTIERLKDEHLAGIANHSHILWSLIIFHDWKNRWLNSNSVSRD